MNADMVKFWRFLVTDFDGNETYLDAEGGDNGDEREAEFLGTWLESFAEGERRANLWEDRTGNLAAKVTSESRGAQ